ncbi:MAG: PAS domain-containing protein [Rhodospirillaceae bacterium]|jgi:two-component system, cell cycle sensor histidine kinase and response regulator CckA|nr:PAS domain-containing protein [Rhodospirillaceae bacterium]MBT5242597.1 PAS domain-containing protein [Rhodospirillaceae bacterium]MBT5566108.1 PAS domain-containing protein [Rhodospirillaceae bacterium]MBT6090635.1 PAS domain-containing protein [Rhodospirillaceae bacterium]
MALALSALVLIGLATNIAVQAVPWLWIVAGASVLWIVAVALIWSVLSQPPTARQSLEAITAIFDSAPGPRFVTDEEGAVVYANPSGADWLDGVTPLDRFAALAAPEYDGEEFVARLGLAAGAGLSDQVEIPLSGEMPEPDWFQVLIRPLESLPNFLVWSLEDITARKAINDILSRERQDLADFLDFMPTGVYSVDVDGAFHYVNQRFAEWLGRSAEELVNLSLDDVLAGASRPDLDGEWQGRVRFQTAAGDAIDTLVFQSTYDDAGVTRTRSLVMRDVKTDIERSEGHGRTGFRVLFDAAPVAIAITEPDGSVTDCNQAFAKLVNRNRDALIGDSLSDFLIEDDRRALRGEFDRVIAGSAESSHVDVRLASGKIGESAVQASVFLGPLSGAAAAAAGEVEGMVVHVIDTTEQKSLEVQFAQAQKMQAMGQLAGGVAHDFNNLLTAMIGFCDLLLQRHAAGDPSFADIMQIKQNANRAANLVRQLLAFSRKQPLQPKELNCTDHLTELSHLLTRLIGESIEYKLVHGRDLGAVRVDPGQFDQIIINLAVNARDAMAGGGTLTITTNTKIFEYPTQLGAEQVPAGRYVTISVTDTGKGIAREDIGRIFEPFFSTKQETPGAGTGLGLATVYGIVRQTGGFILVNSAPGEGAKFTIYLPRIEPETDDISATRVEDGQEFSVQATEDEDPVALAGKIGAALAKSPSKGDLSGSGTILLVEDEDAVRVFAARALKNKGYTVLEARTGEQAMDMLHDAEDLELLITDMMMPGMDGGTLARFVKVERPEVRVILISGYSEEVARGDVLDSPDIHFLPKPFSLGQLASKVKDVLALPVD